MIKSITQLAFMYLMTMLFVEFIFPPGKRFLKYIYWSALLLTLFITVGPYVVRVADDIHQVAVTYSQGKEATDNGITGIASFFKGGFRMPMKGEITQGFSPPNHHGVDIASAQGTPVEAIGEGKVTMVRYDPTYGNMVIIDHGKGVESLYGHLLGINVKSGYPIVAGTVIGSCGSTGRSSGPHLHLEIRKDGKTINPMNLLKE